MSEKYILREINFYLHLKNNFFSENVKKLTATYIYIVHVKKKITYLKIIII